MKKLKNLNTNITNNNKNKEGKKSDNKNNNNLSNDKDDWRYRGQDEYLMGAKLVLCTFNNSIREHDHCNFCWEKFSEHAGDLHEGYCTLDKYHWICKNCCNDFIEMFKWNVVND